MELSELKKELKNIDQEKFAELLRKSLGIKQKEMEEISSNNCVVVGDLHGDLKSLLRILKKSEFFEKKKTLVFLGDYIDRGDNQVEVFYTVLRLREEYPDRVFLLRGNHEYIQGLEVSPHDFPFHLYEYFGDLYDKIYYLVRSVWNSFSFSAILNEQYFLVHGGVPVGFIEKENLKNPDFKIKEQLLWNDPFEGYGFYPSPRGAGFLFGKDITENFLDYIGVKKIIRAHEPCNGFKENHEGKVLTVFSMKGYYGNKHAGFLEISSNKLKCFLL